MGKIETDMIRAITTGEDWHGGNTSVTHDPVIGDVEVEVRLYGHLIAKRFKGTGWEFNLCGYNTPLTRSRMSALICELVPKSLGVSTQKGQALVIYRDGYPSKKVGDSEWFNADPVM